MNKHLFFAFLLFAASFANIQAQDKLFTAEEAVGSNPALYPANISQLQWLANQDVYTYTEGNFLLKGEINTTQIDTLLSLDIINGSLNNIKSDSIRRMPQLKWVNNQTAYFFNQKNLFVVDIISKEIKQIASLPKLAENIEIALPSLKIAYTVENNLFVFIDGKETQITADIAGIENGKTVHRNEFGINKGIYWSPDAKKIAFYRMDETMVAEYPLVDVSTRIATLKKERYPMAGMTSHEVTIGVFDLEQQKTVFLKTGLPADQYLTSVSWHPASNSICTALLNRDQNHMKLNQYDIVSGELVKTLFEEKDEKYVEPLNPLYFLPGSSDQFIWISQRDGFSHLYLYRTSGELVKQLTSGQWGVTDFLGFDPKGSKVFFAATKESPLEQNAYSIDLKKLKIIRISPAKGTHRVAISQSGKFAIDSYSNQQVSREIILLQTNGNAIRTLLENKNPLLEYKLGQTKVFTILASDSTPLYCRMIQPIDFDPQKKYPVIVYVYGGPHAQMITESWLGGGNYYLNYLAQKGYLVFTLDNRGSANRGKAFEQSLHRQAGKVEMEDQMSGINYLKSLPYVDGTRIGVDGWSYGGFMSINLKLNYPETFKVAVAGGPVTDWKYYEVMYGERYMDTPESNPDGYATSSLINQASKLEGKLLIIHGDMDPVVVWQQSLSFLKKCIIEGKQLDYFVYPGYEHNVRGKDRAHLIKKISLYFDENL